MSDRREIEAAVRACEERSAKFEASIRALTRELLGQEPPLGSMFDPEVIVHHTILRLRELERENQELRSARESFSSASVAL